jgi:hypothetical protein
MRTRKIAGVIVREDLEGIRIVIRDNLKITGIVVVGRSGVGVNMSPRLVGGNPLAGVIVALGA